MKFKQLIAGSLLAGAFGTAAAGIGAGVASADPPAPTAASGSARTAGAWWAVRRTTAWAGWTAGTAPTRTGAGSTVAAPAGMVIAVAH